MKKGQKRLPPATEKQRLKRAKNRSYYLRKRDGLLVSPPPQKVTTEIFLQDMTMRVLLLLKKCKKKVYNKLRKKQCFIQSAVSKIHGKCRCYECTSLTLFANFLKDTKIILKQ